MRSEKNGVDDHISADELYFNRYLLRNSFFRPKIVEKKTKRYVRFSSKQKKWKDKLLQPDETILWQNTVLGGILNNSKFKSMHHPILNNTGTWSTYCWIFHKYREYFASYGKGTTVSAALASGYGELLERMQVLAFRSRNPYRPQIFLNTDGLPYESLSQINKEQNEEFKKLLRDNSTGPVLPDSKYHRNYQDLFKYEKFTNLLVDEDIWIQKALHKTSTGLAAGNCYEEAFIQAFCEIVERFQEYKILKDHISLPTIPNSILTDDNRSIIENMRKLNVKVIIKDASRDLQAPAVAVLFDFTRQKSNQGGLFSKFLVKFASASSIDVAVERCLGEVVQGLDSLVQKNIKTSRFILYTDLVFEQFPHLEKFISRHDFYVNFFARKGLYPSTDLEFLIENSGKPRFKEYVNADLNKEVNSILSLLSEKGYRIYMQDFGWAGFPTVKLFIPELNVGALHLSSFSKPEIEEFKMAVMQDPSQLDDAALNVLEDPIFISSLIYYRKLSHVFRIETHTFETMDSWLYFALLAKAYGRADLAERYIKPYLFMNVKKIEDIKEFHEKPDNILAYLRAITPNCLSKCSVCEQQKECRWTVLRDFENNLTDRYNEDLIQKEWRK